MKKLKRGKYYRNMLASYSKNQWRREDKERSVRSCFIIMLWAFLLEALFSIYTESSNLHVAYYYADESVGAQLQLCIFGKQLFDCTHSISPAAVRAFRELPSWERKERRELGYKWVSKRYFLVPKASAESNIQWVLMGEEPENDLIASFWFGGSGVI